MEIVNQIVSSLAIKDSILICKYMPHGLFTKALATLHLRIIKSMYVNFIIDYESNNFGLHLTVHKGKDC